jgi:hypothetical protein
MIKVATIKKNYGKHRTITLRVTYSDQDGYGWVVSYDYDDCTQRAFMDRYDMIDIRSEEEFHVKVKQLSKNAISVNKSWER